MDYVIAVASTADLPREYLDAHRIPFLSYSYMIDGELVMDDCREESKQQVYAAMRAGKRLSTTAINPYTYYEFLKQFPEAGQNVIFLDMSKKMSSSFSNLLSAAKQVEEEYPGFRVAVPDTLSISGGLGFLVKELVRCREAGMSFDEVLARCEEYKLHVAHRFTVDDLSYLKDSGRVSNVAALVGALLAIKPVLYVPDGGTLDVAQKIRGRKHAVAAILERIKADLSEVDTAGACLDILHADSLQEAEYIRDELRKAFPDLGEISVSGLGVVIGAHCGPGLLTFFYYCRERRP